MRVDRWEVFWCPSCQSITSLTRGHVGSDRKLCPLCFTVVTESFEVRRTVCTCPTGWGTVADPRCPEHGRRDPQHTVSANATGLVSTTHGKTSRDAALAVRPKSGTQRWLILNEVESWGDYGMTRDEVAFILHMSPNAVRPRIKELLDGGHLIVAPGRTRPSAQGRASEVLVTPGAIREVG